MSRAGVYTYYYRDGRVEVQDAVPSGEGLIWVDGAYRPPTFPSALSLRVGHQGVRVVTVIRDLKATEGNADDVIKAWDPYLTRQDVDAALDFYNGNPTERDEIDRKLAEDAAPV